MGFFAQNQQVPFQTFAPFLNQFDPNQFMGSGLNPVNPFMQQPGIMPQPGGMLSPMFQQPAKPMQKQPAQTTPIKPAVQPSIPQQAEAAFPNIQNLIKQRLPMNPVAFNQPQPGIGQIQPFGGRQELA